MPNDICVSNVEEYLCHYGIQGMHWGVRRFQPYPKGYRGDGKVIGEAAKAAKRERHGAIAKATLAGINLRDTKKRYAKAVKKSIINRTEATKKGVASAREQYKYWQKEYKRTEANAKKVVRELQRKYGEELIRDIPYKNGVVSGRVFTKKQVAARGALTIASLVGGPFLPGLGAETAILAAPSKKTAALNYRVRTQREAGLNPYGKLEKGLNFAQVASDKLVQDVKEKGVKRTVRDTASGAASAIRARTKGGRKQR